MKRSRAVLVCLAVCAAAAIARAKSLDAIAGKALFERNWITAPSSTDASDGLGPLFNARSCKTCHASGGGARVVSNGDTNKNLVGAVVRFGTADGRVDPYYGLQLQTNAVPGLQPEGTAQFLPKLDIKLAGPPLSPSIKASARLAPPLFGRAAFDLVTDEEILKRADPEDRDNDGISGRANRIGDGIGRYGWKAQYATLEDQIAHAFALDIGLSSPRAPYPHGDCTAAQTDCRAAATGESPLFENREISSAMLALVAAYLESLSPPVTKPDDEGADLFKQTGCAACHVPELATRDGTKVPAFTDLLLHDMGTRLDDGVGEPGVRSSEWRTAPLVGIAARRNGGRYLHDGSAATIAEAIAAHFGEGDNARTRFNALDDSDRQKLIDYVNRQ